MSQDQQETWTITFRPLKSEVPAAIRVRQLLKYALRVQGLRNMGAVVRDCGPATCGEGGILIPPVTAEPGVLRR